MAILPMTLSGRLSPPNSWPESRKRTIKQELAGKEIGGVKLTHRLISDYIEKITAEE